MMDFTFWYAAAPFFLIGLGGVGLFLSVYALLRRAWPPVIKLRPDWDVNRLGGGYQPRPNGAKGKNPPRGGSAMSPSKLIPVRRDNDPGPKAI